MREEIMERLFFLVAAPLLRVLCVSVVKLFIEALTTETQRTRRLHRERSETLFPLHVLAADFGYYESMTTAEIKLKGLTSDQVSKLKQ